MCVNIVKRTGSRPWKLVSKATGKVVGSSRTKADALAAQRARGMAARGLRGRSR